MTSRTRKIAIVLPDLSGGGAERMHVMMAHEWLARGLEVDFVLLRREGDLLQLVPPGARVIELGVARFRDAVLPLCTYLRHHRPSVVLAAMWPLTVVAIVAARLAGTSVRTLVSDHDTLSVSYGHKGTMHRMLMRASMALGYRLADTRIAVSRGVAMDLSVLSGIRMDRFQVIYNPAATGVDPVASGVVPPELADVRGPLILSVGTLKAQKDHTLLIDAFARLAPHLDATLCILGEGRLRGDLERLVVRHGLQGRVLLPGFRVETARWYRRADLFVLSSRHEGFGNVIVEALEQGVPVVSTDCPSGPREILCDGKFGRLVPVGDAAALAAAMAESLSTTHDRTALKVRAQDFSVDKAATQYEALLFPEWRKESRNCPLCGGRSKGLAFPYATRFNNARFNYLKCGDCSSVFVDPVPDGQTFARMYAKAEYHDCHYEGKEGGAYTESAILLKQYLPTGALVLDYGCGVGAFLKALRDQEFVPFGVEFDKDAAEFAGRNAAWEAMSVERFLTLPNKPKFDAIHLGDVLEHLPNPADTLKELLVYLKPGGIVFVEGPLEINPSPVYWVARLFGALKRVARPNFVAADSPTHLFRTGAKQQLAFFSRMEPNLVLKHWHVYETGWPYASGGLIKRAIAGLARGLGSKQLFGATFGNRFYGVFKY